ncbi:GGDEF domain-containing protein [Hoeflea ulvae]|uniref:diguanylate cyclase n=1 Tax=Hoeflea ulvae TaxID=2983764 RepID=A0ABT3YKE0_9HYPH|nr:GGDEF domain-containing protein [Hoeflea ulvae]MCY0096365.1 GGDEF domain-containing protein [Hoeflea ulvae]
MDSTFLLTMINPVAALTFFMTFYLVWRQQPHRRYIMTWAWGYAAAAIGFGFECVNILVPAVPIWLGFNIFLPVSGWFFARGMCRRYGDAVPERLLLAILGLTVAGVFWLGFVSLSALGRGSAASIGLAVILMVGLRAIRRSRKKETLDFGIMFAILAMVFLLLARPVVSYMLEGNPPIGPLALSSFWVVSLKVLGLFGWMLFAILFLVRIADDLLADLKRQSVTDSLSGILNRRGFFAAAQPMADAAATTLPACMLILDIDHFKRINDSHGHQAGDEVIKQIAQVMQAAAPENAVVGRLGGEEFAIFLQNTAGPAARGFAESLCAALRLQHHAGIPDGSPVTVSIGVAEGHGESLDEMFQRADAALYQAKHDGRDRVQLSGPACRDPAAVASPQPMMADNAPCRSETSAARAMLG